jgi:hypothetical protein
MNIHSSGNNSKMARILQKNLTTLKNLNSIENVCKKFRNLFVKASIFSENVFNKPRNSYKSLTSLKMSLKSLKIVQNASHYWKDPPFLFRCYKKTSNFFKKPHHFEKASIPLKMCLKSLAIFEKPTH